MPKKHTTKKRPAAKKAAAKKTIAQESIDNPKRTPKKRVRADAQPKKITAITAICDVGFGNGLYLRGEGPGLSWEKGILMTNLTTEEWAWSTDRANKDIVCKVLLNDKVWEVGDNTTARIGESSVVLPVF